MFVTCACYRDWWFCSCNKNERKSLHTAVHFSELRNYACAYGSCDVICRHDNRVVEIVGRQLLVVLMISSDDQML